MKEMKMQQRVDLRRKLRANAPLIMPGVVDAFWAKLAEVIGFPCVFCTGSGISNTMGMPDIGLTTMTEELDRIRYIVNAIEIPVIADGDTGFGNHLNVMRTVREYERAGVAGVVLEDQAPLHKRAGYLKGKQVISRQEMATKLKAALDSRRDPDIVIIARTDSLAVNGVEEACERIEFYVEIGADMVNVDSPETIDQLKRIGNVKAPLGQLTHQVYGSKVVSSSVQELFRMGFNLVGFPDLIIRVAAKGAKDALKTLKEQGTAASLLERMITMKERWDLVNFAKYQAQEDKLTSVL
jgi:2-methylisocitrate lyase-like PEP mutase family enzyme